MKLLRKLLYKIAPIERKLLGSCRWSMRAALHLGALQIQGGCPSALPIAIAVAGVAGAGGSIAAGKMGSSAANKAAKTQADAANSSAQLQKQAADESLAEQKRQYDASLAEEQKQFQVGQDNLAPWLSAGKDSLTTLQGLMAPGGELSKGWTGSFAAPTDITEQNDPGFQARLKLGQQALERSAAARGNILSGGTLKALDRYGQDYASNEYGNIYNRALGQYQQQYNEFQNNQTNQYNRYANLAGVGQQAATQLGNTAADYGRSVAGLNSASANSISNILTNSASNIGRTQQEAAQARGTGYINASNANSAGIAGGFNNLFSGLTLSRLLGNSSTVRPYINPGSYAGPPASYGYNPYGYSASTMDQLNSLPVGPGV